MRMDKTNKLDYEHFLMVKTAWYYYIENYTQQAIAQLLGVSRGKIIALLARARQTGLIQFNLRQDSAQRMALERAVISRFRLKDAFIVPAASTLADCRESAAQAAAMYILHRAEPGAYINVGYGVTTSRVIHHLAAAAEEPLNLVSLTGGANYYLPTSHPTSAFNAKLYLTPAPLVLSTKALRDALFQEPAVREIQRMRPLSAMSVVGVGNMADDATSIKNGILTKQDFTLLKMQGAVGDILSHFLDKNGAPVAPWLEQRLVSASLETLRSLENVICVAADPAKAEAILAALRGGYLDVLITDEDTAAALLEKDGED